MSQLESLQSLTDQARALAQGPQGLTMGAPEAEVARIMANSGNVVLCSFITPFRTQRDLVRRIIGDLSDRERVLIGLDLLYEELSDETLRSCSCFLEVT